MSTSPPARSTAPTAPATRILNISRRSPPPPFERSERRKAWPNAARKISKSTTRARCSKGSPFLVNPASDPLDLRN
jgi:hypothetical protein